MPTCMLFVVVAPGAICAADATVTSLLLLSWETSLARAASALTGG